VGARAWIAAFSRDAQAEAVEADIRAELESHLQLAEEALRREGRTTEEARREARERFGDFQGTLSACRRVRTGGQFAMQRLQWILILVLGISTVSFALHSRQRAAVALEQQQIALSEGMQARALLAELQQRLKPEPVAQIVVGVGDELVVQCPDNGDLSQRTEVQIDGQALFRDLGWVPVAGKSRPEIEELLAQRYAPLYEDAAPLYVIVKSPD
jgi:hypothetical protein